MINLADVRQLKSHLSKHGLWAKKSLGQHFLIDETALDAIVNAGDISKEDDVLEIGPGPGVLSQRIAPLCKNLLALELDNEMIPPWKELMSEHENVSILHQDALEYIPEEKKYKVVANIPYYITSPLLEHFLLQEPSKRPTVLVFLMQKEVAERICDKKKPSLISWQVKLFGEPSIEGIVLGECFLPPPKVKSAVLKVQVSPSAKVPEEDLQDLLDLMKICYQQPRKTIYNNLKGAPKMSPDKVEVILDKANIKSTLRPHQLDLMAWTSLLSSWRDS